jgi:hypothetical protein
MFHCQECGVNVPHGVPVLRMTTERKLVTFPPCKAANKNVKRWDEVKKKYIKESVDDPGGTGWQILREKMVCSDCWRVIPETVA